MISEPASRRRTSRLLAAAALIAFALFAANFLYFFVDDEGIPLVYARHLLRGQGFTYSQLEGPVEGYSDFLHVLGGTAALAAVEAAGLSPLAVLYLGKALSFACGLGIVLLVWAMLRDEDTPLAGAAAGLAVVALAGPIAVWSCSSLETAPFALGVTALVWALMRGRDRLAAILAIFLLLERIDGFVYAGAAIAAFVLAGDRARRRSLLLRVAAPAGLVFVAYHAWRTAYFGDVLPAPLAAKVLYKLTGGTNIVEKRPELPYVVRFAGIYGWWAVAACALALLDAVRHGGARRALALCAAALVAYVSVVGDWMFGFRFFTPILPLLAVLTGVAIGRLARASRPLGAAVAVACVAWMAVCGARFFRVYAEAEQRTSFLASPSRDPHRFFGSYYDAYEAARPYVAPGGLMAYNQAGLVPFLLDATNIDDVGLCSRFHAHLPSTDLYFTEVGRYAPLTNGPIIRPTHAYLLYHDVPTMIVRTDLLRSANAGRIPEALLDGFYTLARTDARRENAVYVRSDRSTARFRRSPDAFVENVAHVSYVDRAAIDGRRVLPESFLARFPMLRDGRATFDVAGHLSLHFVFARDDEPVQTIAIEQVQASVPGQLTVVLRNAAGRQVAVSTADLEAARPLAVWEDLPAGSSAASVELRVDLDGTAAGAVRFVDVRVLGQSPALAAYVRSHLDFPADSGAQPDR